MCLYNLKKNTIDMALKDKLNELLEKFNLKAVEVETEVEVAVETATEVEVEIEVEATNEVEVEVETETEEVEEVDAELAEDKAIDEAHDEAEAIVEEEQNTIYELKEEVNGLKSSLKDILSIIEEMNKENKENKIVLEDKINEVADEPSGKAVVFSAEVSDTQEVELSAVEKRIQLFNDNYEELYNFLAEQATINGKEIAE